MNWKNKLCNPFHLTNDSGARAWFSLRQLLGTCFKGFDV